MKKIVLFVAVAVAFALTMTSCNQESNPAEQNVQTQKKPVMSFEKKEHDFGTIQQGEKVSYTFHFTNTGEGDLIITNAKGSCGCTVPDYPKEAIHPGETGDIKVSFNSTGKSGNVTKSVFIDCNTAEKTETLTIKSYIETTPQG